MKYLKTFVLLSVVLFGTAQVMGQKSSGQSSSDQALNQSEGNLLEVFIPNAFTPNMDGMNDVFKPVISGDEIEFYELLIMNRTGKEMFSSSDPSEVWDGTAPGTNYISSPSIFVYILKVKSANSLEYQVFKGHVVMVR